MIDPRAYDKLNQSSLILENYRRQSGTDLDKISGRESDYMQRQFVSKETKTTIGHKTFESHNSNDNGKLQLQRQNTKDPEQSKDDGEVKTDYMEKEFQKAKYEVNQKDLTDYLRD